MGVILDFIATQEQAKPILEKVFQLVRRDNSPAPPKGIFIITSQVSDILSRAYVPDLDGPPLNKTTLAGYPVRIMFSPLTTLGDDIKAIDLVERCPDLVPGDEVYFRGEIYEVFKGDGYSCGKCAFKKARNDGTNGCHDDEYVIAFGRCMSDYRNDGIEVYYVRRPYV